MQSWEFDYLCESHFENIPEDLSEDDKVYIYAVSTRLRRILNWNPKDENQLYSRQRGYETMRELLSLFYAWKVFISQSDAQDNKGRQHLVVFSLAKLLLYYWITDSALVAEVLREIFECDGHFSSMFAHVISRSDGRSILRQSSDYSIQREDTATIFFLHHAYKTKLEFRGVRFLDLPLQYPLEVSPVFLAVIYNKPRILLHLLRFGANIDMSLPCKMSDGWNLSMILRHLVRTLWNYLGETPRQEEVHSPVTPLMSDSINNAADCLSILLRVIPQIRMGELNFLLVKFQNGAFTGSFCSHDYIQQLSEKNIVRKFVSRYLQPSELQHLCRCAIRDSLNQTWNLPYGISSLPLPTLLKKYLSLTYD